MHSLQYSSVGKNVWTRNVFLHSPELVCHADTCLLFCNGSRQTSGRSASFSLPLAGGIMGIPLMNERKIGKAEERKKDFFFFSNHCKKTRPSRLMD